MNIGGGFDVFGGLLVPFVSVVSLSVMVVKGLYRFCISVGAIAGSSFGFSLLRFLISCHEFYPLLHRYFRARNC
jgi:hypothetical protein